jgi:hypothetical protein
LIALRLGDPELLKLCIFTTPMVQVRHGLISAAGATPMVQVRHGLISAAGAALIVM